MVRRRRVLGGVILAAAAVLGFGALEWREIAVRWRLAELGRQGSESELPAALVDAAPGTVEWEVLGRYVRTPAGKERLLRSYLSLLESSRGGMSERTLRVGSGGKTAVLLAWMGPVKDWAIAWKEPAPFGPTLPQKPVPIPVSLEDLRLWWCFQHERAGSRLQDLVLEIGYEDHPIPGRPGARFSVVSHIEAGKPRSRSFSWNSLGSDYACLIESEPYRLAPSP